MKNPFGADGVFTKIGEHVPLVNKGIQKLHERAGQHEALQRSRNRDPLGANGYITRASERVPVLNNGIQSLHKRAGKDEALERAREKNPLGANGYVTKAAEHVPIMNLGVQELHRHAGKEEALARARERNPLGPNGYITQMGEQVPVLNDGIAVLHHLAGHSVAEERARGKSLQSMVSKDGAITKVAEVLPGLNLVAAALHEMSGNHDEAMRALDLVRNWEKVGKPDGVLAKVAELVPGTDIIAFALHLNAGHYPQALRTITKTSWVHLSVDMFVIDAHCRRLRKLHFNRLVATDMAMEPKGLSIHGALLDLVLNYLHVDKSGKKRQQKRLKMLEVDDKDRSPKKSFGDVLDVRRHSYEAYEGFERSLTEAGLVAVCNVIDKIPSNVEASLVIANAVLAQKRKESKILHSALPNEIPPPDEELIEALQDSIANVKVFHMEMPPPPRVQLRRGRLRENRKYGLPEYMAAASCFSFLGCLGFGAPTGSAACLTGVVGLAAQARRMATRRLAPFVNDINAKAWAEATAGARSSRPVGSSAASAASASSSGPPGVVVELDHADAKKMSQLIRSYVLDALFGQTWSGPLLSILEPHFRSWLGGLTFADGGEADDKTVPLVVRIEVPEQIVPDCGGPSLDLRLPNMQFAVTLDISTQISGPVVRSARIAAVDSMIEEVIGHVREQVAEWDLREADPRLRGFTQAVNAKFGFQLHWVNSDQLRITVSGLRLELHLPK